MNSKTKKLKHKLKKTRKALKNLVKYIEQRTCTHEQTYRGGTIWEICCSCKEEWADDKGGKPEFTWPEELEKAQMLLRKNPKKQLQLMK